ncbi:M20 family metallo-hydrolase [Reichenbachiella carrageenanivorans]|uniref:M20 family metallo-hydrolase n=1 Tax=Reichenbachiella carrageenanivorans TaxID=2979869 RepID=A0ABY6CXV3_9BACT|nr:M20 family metallo-hydrolase [Reichenbachiella carrageenanivorans]UXX78742.1 M20 family metallo-hydrolase [Reichenbachiella carrageenanivorans]
MPEVAHTYDPRTQEAVALLSGMIEIQSFSREENQVADFVETYFTQKGLKPHRAGHNLWLKSKYWDDAKPTILLNSHMDTVKPAASYTLDPFKAQIIDGKLYGLGSNDAGGPLVCLIQAFLHYQSKENLPFNLILAATAEEEISGANGVASILPELGTIDLGIVGEPTLMDMAVAEKGLIVIDCEAKGVSGHAARNEGENAIYKALAEIEKLRNYEFEKESAFLGPIKKTVTLIEAGTQHNVVPDSCKFVIDVRTTDAYSNAETVRILDELLDVEVRPRSIRLNSSGLPLDHPIIKKGESMGMKKYGSPTLSDQALMPFQTIKIGPGDSARSHTADEYIGVDEIEAGVKGYIELLKNLKL